MSIHRRNAVYLWRAVWQRRSGATRHCSLPWTPCGGGGGGAAALALAPGSPVRSPVAHRTEEKSAPRFKRLLAARLGRRRRSQPPPPGRGPGSCQHSDRRAAPGSRRQIDIIAKARTIFRVRSFIQEELGSPL